MRLVCGFVNARLVTVIDAFPGDGTIGACDPGAFGLEVKTGNPLRL